MRPGTRLALAALLAALGAARVEGSTVAPNEPVAGDADDDPKCARGECRPPRVWPVDEDDPKLARGLKRRRPTPRFDLDYRFLQIADPYGGSLPFHLVEATGYPVSGIFRLGISIAGGGATRYDAWMCDVGLSVGVQYPARVTPFLDVRFSAGVIGAEIVGRKVVSYQFRPTIEGGIAVFLAGRMHLTAAVGWSHPIYGGVDAKAIEQMIQMRQTPKYEVQNLSLDTATVRVGLGF